jgi:hypothetical protein
VPIHVRPTARGAHRETAPPATRDPVRARGPRGWVVSVGVLGVLGVLGVAGALVVDGGGGSSGSAAVVPEEGLANGWTVATLTPRSDPGSTGAPAGPGEAASGTPSASRGASSPGAPLGDDNASGTASGLSASASGVGRDDLLAGVATTQVVQSGTGRLVAVPGTVAAPGRGRLLRVRVEVEEGIGADGPAFAEFVMNTLNDRRGWSHAGVWSFARTDGAADIRVILASPDLSARLCAPAQTHGTVSCGGQGRAVLTMYRWMTGTPDYGTDLTGYRHQVVNHEVGHVLGYSNAYCDPGHLAPVMVEQTNGLHGCLPNPWPFPVSS